MVGRNNIFIAVDAELEYAKVEAHEDGRTETLYVAEEWVNEILKHGRYEDYDIVETT